MFERTHNARSWGFRFFATDAVVIGVLAAAAIALRRIENPLWWILIVVAGHFFLFCNIVRIRRRLEFIWAGLFIANIGVWLWFGELGWLGVLCVQLPITLCLVLIELRSGRYHGVLARRTNPRLNDYLEGKIP
jgi:hypothetical protein